MASRRGRSSRNTKSTPEKYLKEEASPSPAAPTPKRGAGNSDSGSESTITPKIEKQSPQPKVKPSPMKTEVKPEKTETPEEEPMPDPDPELEPDHESLQAALQEALESDDTTEVNMTESMVSSFVEAAKMAAEKAKNETSFKTGSKRKAEDGEEPELMDVETDSDGNKNGKPRAKRKRKSLGPVTPKNALMQLNELKPGLTFDFVSQTGPNHSPIFTVKVTVNDNEFEGSGTSKKRAKTQAAERALSSFVQFRNASEAHVAMGRNVVNGDFTIDSDDLSDAIMTDFSPDVQGAGAGGAPPSNGGDMTSPPVSKTPAEQPKNPVMLLNEVRPGMKYEFEGESGENQNKSFVMSVTIDDRKFEGAGRSKKLAKSKAAQEALLEFFGIDCSQGAAMKNGMGQVLPSSDAPRLPQTLADHIMKLVFNKFTELTNADGTNYARRKVLAGFVVTQGMEPEDARVVCLATGTKCINGEYISDQGLALNDCHAEIIARRSFKRYLFGQLALLLGSEEEISSSIFISNSSGGYKLKDDVQVHLYISTSPCGDARIFSPHETLSDASQDKHPNRKARGQLRTKIESGEGTIPVKSSPSIQTWDGVLQGERLLTMSCSDKVCKWNTLGLQGSLLSHFVEPIYLNSVILGSLYHGDHLSRAMFGRVSNIKELPSHYRVNRPYLSCISNPERRQPGKAPGFSVNWALGDSHLEVINCTTGKDEQGSPSQVCKQALFSMFQQLYGRLSSITPPAPDANMGVYCDMKQLVTDYQTAKAQLYQCFLESGLGIWVGKPMEQDVFSLSH